MTDRELLEAAAMAAGHETSRWVVQPHGDREGLQFPGAMGVWNPLTDDGDALRLAVKLGIDVSHNTFGNVIADHYRLHESQTVVLPHGANPCAATRRAIVRIAAALWAAKAEASS